jgi:hypothetical protein
MTAKPTRLPLSPEAQQARRPLPPDALASEEKPVERAAGGAGRAVRTERREHKETSR